MNGKKLYPSKFVKYLGILMNSQLNFSYHINSISNKLGRAIGMLSKICHYVTKDTLHSIYFGIFSSVFIYGWQIWGLRSNHFIRLERLQNKAIKIINFANFYDPILPLSDNIKLLNFLYVLDDINHNMPPALENTFQLVASSHDYLTRKSVQHNVSVPSVQTTIYGLKSMKYQSCQAWNFFINHFKDTLLHTKSKSVCKKICNFFFNTLKIVVWMNIYCLLHLMYHVCINVCICSFVYMCMGMCVCVYIYACICVHMHDAYVIIYMLYLGGTILGVHGGMRGERFFADAAMTFKSLCSLRKLMWDVCGWWSGASLSSFVCLWCCSILINLP